MAAKARKPFISRKRRREMDAARQRRESMLVTQEQERKASDLLPQVQDNEKHPIALPPVATVGGFAELAEFPVARIMSLLMKNGVMAAINDQIDYDTMAIVADELGLIAEPATAIATTTTITQPTHATTEGRDPRPPVVTIMGHVDHGKTSLLDTIRKTNIAGKEHGGITQHIGAYQAKIDFEDHGRLITFLDTPGHEAFTALRSHGAQVTDIVILVVAADDGVKPQTIEALNHAKNANVPIIVAITKIDLQTANIERLKQQLTEHGLIPEEWGGETIMVGVSSVTGVGIKELLEYIIITADLKQYKADPGVPAQGIVIESHQETGLGAVATILVQNGTLHLNDVVVIGQTFGKIRSMQDYTGARLTEALPSTPARISGLQAIPEFGESFAAVANEKAAKEMVQSSDTTAKKRTIMDISQAIAEGRTNTLNIILKADAQGSLEALRTSITKLEEPGVQPLIIHSGIGDISLNDIQLAAASTAIVLGFHVNLPVQIKRAAENQGITVATFQVIYDLLNQVESTLKGRIRTKRIRVEKGRLKVKKIFRTTKETQIIGGEITQGVAVDPAKITVMREGEAVGEGKILSLQKGPEAVKQLEAGQESGLSINVPTKVAEGDVIIFSVEEEVFDTDNKEPDATS